MDCIYKIYTLDILGLMKLITVKNKLPKYSIAETIVFDMHYKLCMHSWYDGYRLVSVYICMRVIYV